MVSYRATKDPKTPVSVLKELGTIHGEVLYQSCSWHQKSSAFLSFQQTHIGIFVLGCPPSPCRTSCVRARRHCLDLSRGELPGVGICPILLLWLLSLDIIQLVSVAWFRGIVEVKMVKDGHWVQQQLRSQVFLGWHCYRDVRADVVPTKSQWQPRK